MFCDRIYYGYTKAEIIEDVNSRKACQLIKIKADIDFNEDGFLTDLIENMRWGCDEQDARWNYERIRKAREQWTILSFYENKYYDAFERKTGMPMFRKYWKRFKKELNYAAYKKRIN